MPEFLDSPTSPPAPPPGTFVDVLLRAASARAEHTALVFLEDGEHETARFTYRELLERTLAVAAELQRRGAAGERALLLLPPGPDYVVGLLACFCSGALAVPGYPPRGRRGAPRLEKMVRDCQAGFALVDPALAEHVPHAGRMECLSLAEIDLRAAASWSRPHLTPDSPVYLQYTSGSTADPRGVVLRHSNLLAHARGVAENFHGTRESVGVSWLPPYHDMGLIGSILQPIYMECQMVLMPPVMFLQRPIRWLRAIEKYGGDISGGPNFAYELAAAATTPEERRSLDLSRWRVAFCGAEPVRHGTLARFAEAFAESGFRPEALHPCYGLAEATLAVASSRFGKPHAVARLHAPAWKQGKVSPAVEAERKPGEIHTLVSSGPPLPGTEIRIVDPESRRTLPENQVGEVWVHGPQVAAGYWNRPEETARTFEARPADALEAGPFLRTGDLGFLRDGELFVTGRIKEVIILNGRNYYPHDLEQSIESCHPALFIAGCAAFSVDDGESERLIAAAEVNRRLPEAERESAIAAIRRVLAEEHDLQPASVLLLRRGSLPKTTSGKAQRQQCRALFEDGALDILARWDRPRAEAARFPTSAAEASEGVIRDWLRARVAALAGMPEERIELHAPFAQYGLGSTAAAAVAGELSAWLARPVAPTLVYEYPNIAAAARFLGGERDSLPAGPPKVRRSQTDFAEPIAIVGLACRFPGAPDPRTFWQLLSERREGIGPMSTARRRGYFPAAGETEPPPAGWLNEVDTFDAEFFAISPREAASLDPQQRLALELAFEALRDAGLPAGPLRGTATGVFLGISTGDYGQRQLARGAADVHANTGSALSIAANRISYALDLRGPSLAVDTACSSSLAAVHLACRALALGECDLALAGGVGLLLTGDITANLKGAGFLAADGRCKAFSAAADGYGRGEGGALVALRPLSAARAAGDRVVAVIRGTAMNQDGRSNGLTAPSREAQVAVVRAALAAAGTRPEEIDYLEAHGTGTVLGDAVEARALGEVFAGSTPVAVRREPWLLGSVKTNLGHLEAAAGIAGLLKLALALRHGHIPASLHFEEPNPHIPFEALRLQVVGEGCDWPARDRPGRGGISSFGFGGTNVHAILEAAPDSAPSSAGEQPAGESALLLPMAAPRAESLPELAELFARRLERSPEEAAGLCAAAALRAEHYPWRLAVVGSNAEALAAAARERAAAFHSAPPQSESPPAPPRVIFLFAGQGPRLAEVDWEGLRAFPSFAQTWAQACAYLERSGGWSPEKVLRRGKESELRRSDRVQPISCALNLALFELWRSLGIVPDRVLGHSLGEIAAAYGAGVLSLEDSLELARLRGELVQTIAGTGGTAAAAVPAAEIARRIAAGDWRLEIACVNGPGHTVVSGAAEGIEALLADCAARDEFAQALPIDLPFHHSSLEPLAEQLGVRCGALRAAASRVPFISTRLGAEVPGEELHGEYWARNLREPVNLPAAVEAALAGAERGVVLEIGPQPLFALPLAPVLEGHAAKPNTRATLRRGRSAATTVREAAAALYEFGCDLHWESLAPSVRWVTLPQIPWRRERHWLSEAPPAAAPAVGHPLLGVRLPESAPHPEEAAWLLPRANAEGEPDGADPIEQLLSRVRAALELLLPPYSADDREFEVRDLNWDEESAPSAGPREYQLVLRRTGGGAARFELYSRGTTEDTPAPWRREADGTAGWAPAAVDIPAR